MSLVYQLIVSQVSVSDCKRVVCQEDIFNILHEIHYVQMNHSGYHSVFKEVSFKFFLFQNIILLLQSLKFPGKTMQVVLNCVVCW